MADDVLKDEEEERDAEAPLVLDDEALPEVDHPVVDGLEVESLDALIDKELDEDEDEDFDMLGDFEEEAAV